MRLLGQCSPIQEAAAELDPAPQRVRLMSVDDPCGHTIEWRYGRGVPVHVTNMVAGLVVQLTVAASEFRCPSQVYATISNPCFPRANLQIFRNMFSDQLRPI